MRLLLLLAGVAAIAAVHAEDPKRVPRHTLAANYYGDLPAAKEEHTRDKRAVNGYRKPCEAGWTGTFCENPICHERNDLSPFETDMDKDVDIMYLPENCAGEYYVPYDATTSQLSVTVTIDRGVPAIILTGEDGSSPSPVSIEQREGVSTARFQAPAGAYVLSIDLQGVPSKSCIVHVQARSKLTFDGGFVNAPQADSPPFGESGESDVPNYFIAHPFNLASPGEVNTVTIRNVRYLGALYRSTLTRRYDCSYEYYAGEFTCRAGETYLYIVEGRDQSGKAYRRSHTFSCFSHPVTSSIAPPATTPFSVPDCYNGGTLLNNTAGYQFCFCPELWQGVKCQEAVCMNGGIPLVTDKSHCNCVPGFQGRNCEKVVCDPNVSKILTDVKTLVVVIRNSKTMADYIDDIQSAIDDEVIHNVVDGRNAYEDFILVTYRESGYVTSKQYPFRDFANFGADLTKLKTQYSDVQSCSASILPALQSIYFQLRNPQSPTFIFTDAVADQSDIDNFRNIMSDNSQWRLQMHTFFMKTNPGCPLDTSDRALQFFHNLGRFTAGLVHSPKKEDLQTVFIGSMRSATYHMNLVDSGDLRQCAMQMKALIVDASATNLTIVATGVDLQLTMTDPSFGVAMNKAYYTDNDTYFWHLESPQAGEYLYAIHSTKFSPCSFRIFAQSQYDLFLGTTVQLDVDERTVEPIVGQPAHLLAQLNGLHGQDHTDQFRLFAEILITSPNADDSFVPLYYSSGLYRSGCGFHLYFGVANFCQYEDQIFYATVYADDRNGNPIQRTSIGYCTAAQSPTPAPEDCWNGGVKVNGTTCWCPAHFTGGLCEIIECQNGGTAHTETGTCSCPYGLAGRFCELMECSIKNDESSVSFDHRTLNFVVSTKYSMKATVQKLAHGAVDFAKYFYRNTPNWIDHFTIIAVNQTGQKMIMTHSPGEFATAFQNLADNFDSYSDSNNNDCAVLINTGIKEALYASFPNSNIFVFADSQASENDTTFPEFLDLLDFADEMHTEISFFGTSVDMCGSGSFGSKEEGIADFTGGKVFYTTQIDRVFTYINSFYYSGVILDQSGSCSSGMDIYFPVEALAHNLVITVQGDSPQITVTSPDGKTADYEDSIVKDNRLIISQYVPACDSHWDSKGQYCYQYDTEKIGFLAALVKCGNVVGGSYMVDILTTDKHDQVTDELSGMRDGAWIGLTRDGTTNNFHWLQWGVDPIPLPASMRVYFAPNQDDLMTNPAYQYVYMKPDGLWYLATMDDRHLTICQKDRYGGNYDPLHLEPDLPPGFWHVNAKSSGSSCTVQVRAQSEVQVFYGFVTNQHDDMSKGTINVNSKSNYVVATAIGLGTISENIDIPEGRIDYATVGTSNSDYFPLALTQRSGCAFDAISKIPFSCPSNKSLSAVQVKFHGIDQFGLPFERLVKTRCDTYTYRCMNGGILHEGECICPSHYAGIDCKTVICDNGGRGNLDGTCACPAQYSGSFCEFPKCDPPYPSKFPKDGRTLAVLMDLSFEMKAPLFYLAGQKGKDAIHSLVNKRPGWFKNFYLKPFDSKKNQDTWYNVTKTRNVDDFIDAFHHVDVCTQFCDDTCPRPISEVLMGVLADPDVLAPDSVVVVITHSAIEDYSLLYQLLPTLISKRVHLHFVLTGVNSPCNLGWNNEMNDAMQTYASFSVGSILNLTPKQVMNFFSDYLPSLYSAQDVVMDSISKGDCEREIVFQVDHSTDEFTLEFYGAEASNLTMVGPNGPVDLPPSAIPGSTNYFGIFNVSSKARDQIVPGNYLVKTKSPGKGCQVRVRASSSIELTLGYVQVTDSMDGASQDDAHFTPIRGKKNGLIIHADGLDYGNIEYVQLATSKGEIITSREVIRRDSACAYQFYMQGSFDCDYIEFEIVVYGVDKLNNPFHRNFKGHCDDNRPQPDPPKPTCSLTAMKADIVFLLDSSVDNTTLNWFNLAASSTMGAYTVSSDFTKAAAMTISNVPEKGGFFTLNDGNSSKSFVENLNKLYADGTQGQNINKAVNSLMRDVYTQQAGWRRESTRKLLVYLTSTEPTDADPANPIRGLVDSKTTGVVVVTLGIKNPSNVLLSLVEPRCRFFVMEPPKFFTNAPYFINNLMCSPTPYCGM